MTLESKNKNECDLCVAPASHTSESALIQGLCKRENWAFRTLIDQWAEKLFRVAYRFMRTQEDAEEIVQEVMQKIIEKIDSFQGDSLLYTWIYRITVNQALMRLRSQKGKFTVLLDEVQNHFEDGMRKPEIADLGKLPDEMFLQKEFQKYFSECVDKLSDDLKTAYLLKEVEGLSEESVCEILAITKPAMKNRVHRARLILRDELGKKYGH